MYPQANCGLRAAGSHKGAMHSTMWKQSTIARTLVHRVTCTLEHPAPKTSGSQHEGQHVLRPKPSALGPWSWPQAPMLPIYKPHGSHNPSAAAAAAPPGGHAVGTPATAPTNHPATARPACGSRVDDVLELNVNGHIMHTTRSTLQQMPGAALWALLQAHTQGSQGAVQPSNGTPTIASYSQWHTGLTAAAADAAGVVASVPQLARDAAGRLRLDVDPHVFARLLQHLRELKMATTGGPFPSHIFGINSSLVQLMRELLPMRQNQQAADVYAGPVSPLPLPNASTDHSQPISMQSTNAALPNKLSYTSHPHASSPGHALPFEAMIATSQLATQQANTVAKPPPGRQVNPLKGLVANNTLSYSMGGSSGHGFEHGQGQRRVRHRQRLPHTQPPYPFDPPSEREQASSQLFYIQAQHDNTRGLRVSVCTEADVGVASANQQPSERYDVFCDATYHAAHDQRLSFTFVARKDFDSVMLGVTTQEQLDKRGAHIPCMGWKSHGHASASALPGPVPRSPAAMAGATWASVLAPESGEHASMLSPKQTLWSTGDSVELLLFMGSSRSTRQHHSKGQRKHGMARGSHADADSTGVSSGHAVRGASGGDIMQQKGQPGSMGLHRPSLTLKVNGKVVDVLHHLPKAPMHQWVWYVGLWTGGDMSAALFAKDSYSVCWQDYVVKRFLS